MTNSLGGFTAFIFICLSDQIIPGSSQTNVLHGGHHATEEFFRWLRSQLTAAVGAFRDIY